MLKELGITFLQILKKTLQYKYFWWIILLITIMVSLCRINLNRDSKYNEKEKMFQLKVIEKTKKNNQYTIVLKGKEKIISQLDNFPYDVGDIIFIKGSLEKINNNTIPNLFNYKKYLQSREIYWKLRIDESKLLKKNANLWNNIKKKIISRIDSYNYREYLYAFILGDTSYFESNIRYQYEITGLSYILAIGSFQVMIIIGFLEKVEKKIRVKRRKKVIINIIVIILYIFFTNKTIGVLRSGLCYILKSILNYKNIKVSSYNISLIVGIVLLTINPYYLNNVGFLYSFSISLAINLLREKIKGNYIKRLFTISIIAFIVGFPITIYNNYEVNFLAIIYSFLLVPIFSFIVFPFSIIVFFFPIFSFIYDNVIFIIENIINIFSKIDFLTFVFRKPSMLIVLFYFIITYWSFYQKKLIYILISVMVIHYNINSLVKENLIAFLDVKQGDSIVIKNNNQVALIDTGGNNYNDYSDEIVKYFKSLGISRINKIILSHGDNDHIGGSINLVNNFKAEKVIFNCDEFNELEEDLIKILDKKKIPYYSCIKELNLNDIKLFFLQTRNYHNENDNSNVIYTEIDGYKFIFMGDAGINREKDVLAKYNISNIDVLKVGHHGSKTSSSESFINEINPKYSIISVGKKNRYGHPNKEVLNILED